jgi:hypothetical protein
MKTKKTDYHILPKIIYVKKSLSQRSASVQGKSSSAFPFPEDLGVTICSPPMISSSLTACCSPADLKIKMKEKN